LEQVIRYGLVGTGMMGVEHIQNLAITPGAELVAIADPVGTSLGWAKSALGEHAVGVTEFGDGAALAASGLVDAVIVASPNYTHREVLEPLFDAGLHILCEKPLATTIDDARWVVNALRRRRGCSGRRWNIATCRLLPSL
jgi:myo-inositol 2-dehydrogenase / D-chiro-inositol 1-dehydrogenase